MSKGMSVDDSSLQVVDASTIREVEILPYLLPSKTKIEKTCKYFFNGKYSGDDNPFKGFILLGPPGTGKTEIIKQVARDLGEYFESHGFKVYFMLIDGSNIAAPKWGEAEKALKRIFSKSFELQANSKKPVKIILLFDDIESLVLRRGVDLAKEWHYSINSILFHELDDINPSDTVMFATSNKPELVDEAILTRLYPIMFQELPVEHLMIKVNSILENTGVSSEKKLDVVEKIKTKLMSMDNPTIRDAQQFTIVECIEGGIWQ
jgi:SpoVK/Ycf46/Vps4 family AAA+-type ATPase